MSILLQENDSQTTDTAIRDKFGSSATAEVVVLKETEQAAGRQYVRLELLGTTFHLPIPDAVDLVDAVATALAGVAE